MASPSDSFGGGAEVPVGRLRWIQVDCASHETLLRFWGALLGVEPDVAETAPPDAYRCLRPLPSGLTVCFQRVPEPKTAKNRLHFDIEVDDLEAATARVEALGGQRLPSRYDFAEDGWRWRVMLDPEGNEFCLVPRGD